MKRLAALLVVIAVLGFGTSRGYDWWNYNVNTPVSSKSEPVVFQIEPGELPSQVSEDLYAQRLIKDRNAFDLYLKITGAGSTFQAGSFLLNRNMTLAQIVDALQHGTSTQVSVTIPEGFPLREQAKFVERSGLGKGADYLAVAAEPSWTASYSFLSSRPAKANPPLEGYLFPDTYLVDPGDVHGLVKAQLDQFGKKPPIEDWRIAAVVTETRNDDPSGHEGLHQCLDGLNRQVRLVRDTDQRGICCLCKRAQPDGD